LTKAKCITGIFEVLPAGGKPFRANSHDEASSKTYSPLLSSRTKTKEEAHSGSESNACSMSAHSQLFRCIRK
jgi:hypothetical protein